MSSAASGEQKLHTRRAIGLVLMSVFLPGSAQFVAGNRALGRWVMRGWGVLVLLILGFGLGLLLFRDSSIALLVWIAPVARVLVWVCFIGWVCLLVDAWRLAQPPRLERRNRLALTVVCGLLVATAGFGSNLLASGFSAAHNLGAVFQGGGDREQKAGRYNILLLGVDAAAHREGIRPDSINVASIDAKTGRTVIFGLPRNLERVPFPASSPLHKLYPDGYVCQNDGCMLNGIYTLGEDHKDLYPGKNAGLEATKEAVSQTLGLELNYYAMIDMGGFQSIIQAMGGIQLDSNRRVPIGGGSSKISGYIEPGNGIHLDGRNALWYARSRAGASDYERMIRQKCVMSAMAKQLNPMTVATKFEELSRAGKDLLQTDVGTDRIASLVELALKGKSLEIASVNFMPPLIVSARPDFELIRQKVKDAIAASQALDAAQSAEKPAPKNEAQTQKAQPKASTAKPADAANPSKPAKPATSAAASKPEDKAPADWICRVR